MVDMLVSLMDLPDSGALLENLRQQGIYIVRALAPDKQKVADWIKASDSKGFAPECEVCFARMPVSCYLAVRQKEILGFACYNAIAPDFFGPTMVTDSCRGLGVGKALLLKSLEALREEGYVYAVIGGVGPEEFYRKCVGATVIPNSSPGIYRNLVAWIK